MRSRIYYKFQELKSKNKKAMISFITGGDPNIETTKKLIYTLEKAGADIIEIGIPYSDPLADGPIIQEASIRALESGTTINKIFNMIKEVRLKTEIPLVFLIYYNCIFHYGIDKFIAECEKTGVDGLIVPDIPLEERAELTDKLNNKPVNLIPLVAPTSKERIKKIVKESEGFVYCISYLGVTGKTTGKNDELDINELIKTVKENTDIPTAVGFGVSTAEDVKNYAKYFDGIIIGSAIVNRIKEGIASGDIEKRVFDYISEMNKATITN